MNSQSVKSIANTSFANSSADITILCGPQSLDN